MFLGIVFFFLVLSHQLTIDQINYLLFNSTNYNAPVMRSTENLVVNNTDRPNFTFTELAM